MAEEKKSKSPLDGAQTVANAGYDVLRWFFESPRRILITAMVVCLVAMIVAMPNFRRWSWNTLVDGIHYVDSLFESGSEGETHTPNSNTSTSKKVKASPAKVRADAGYSAKVIDILNKGDVVSPTGEKKTIEDQVWIQVKLPDGRKGWMLKSLVE